MRSLKRFTRCRPIVLLAGLQIVSWACAPLGVAAEFTTLYRFDYLHGSHPMAGLERDNSAGTLYGTTWTGGENGYGVVYSLTPPDSGKTKWREKILYDFDYRNE